ncbi:hypothetical protein INT47_010543 [Mucor saturninus]|uniref:Transmembrane protein n=1 Tax=Mucor saturninus TaxID=64648 RepID=A0A8H7UYG3_9FUNG|nr:hypothetical protein INT47_010543 [Mucor saturninus]
MSLPHEPKACGCLSLRAGSVVICFIWAAFSMYLAVLSFQNQSLFYSYLAQAPIMVYGVCNLILSIVSMGGMAVLAINVSAYVQTLSHSIFVCVFLVLVDGFVNVILFITSQSAFYNWCVDSSSQTITETVNATLIETNNTLNFDFSNSDYYNCHNLWQDELKFGIIFYILMFAFYIYWALCIYRFSLYRREYQTSADFAHYREGMPMMTGANVNIPQAAIINGNPNIPPGATFPNDRSIIVLNNQKPRSKSNKKKEAFSFRNIKKSIVTPSTVSPMHDQLHVPFSDTTRRDSQFTIGFRLGPDGNIIDIENAPSPTPTYINGAAIIDNQQQQLKRKPITKEDHHNQYYDGNDEGYY